MYWQNPPVGKYTFLYFQDLIHKVEKAVATKGPAYVHILSVCPTGWRCPGELTVRLGRLAVETGIFPLYEIENGKYKLNSDLPQLRPVRDYMKLQGRFRHLFEPKRNEALLNEIQQRVERYWEEVEQHEEERIKR